MDTGLLIIHVVVGALFVGHGAGKLFGLFGGPGLTGHAAYIESLGLRQPRLAAVASGANELVGGLLIALGLLVPLGAALVAANMLVAARTEHRGKGPWLDDGGWETVLAHGSVVVALAFAGAGRWSLDAALGLELAGTAWGLAAAATAIAGGLLALALFRPRSAARETLVPAA